MPTATAPRQTQFTRGSRPAAPARRVKTRLPAEFRSGSTPHDGLTNFLGWFSIGLGVTELLFPRRFADAIGARDSGRPLMMFYGLREISAGVGILNGHDPAPWLYARVVGDGVDLATLAAELNNAGNDADRRNRLLGAIAAVAGVTALDVVQALKHGRNAG
jgi:hypothetical protein